ncbi:domain of unknown function DUF1726 [Pyrolobus fumarii 1A]|uniref:tRNA(Met) cytidine acetyltransferase TmcA n=1 Tax=Pyrolobus fumarii (strain DSM 11204 / 1A) TaxID=694429 RepID=G0EGD6_PYRF1|nr:tRNA(Met) cytidine acetyltransferase TmcA [Pyrolobus fumarii]AEM39161.1 domain of unknown function DUF1726 [Pyrolobus fumarii 1A]
MTEVITDVEKLSKRDIEEIARRVVRNLGEYIPASYQRLLRKLGKAIEAGIRANHRRLLVISGEDPVLVGALAARAMLFYERVYRRIRGREELPVLYVFHDEFNDAKLRKEIVKRALKERGAMITPRIARYEESEQYLGTTFRGLILDLVNDLKPNDVGRLVGVVEGGGLIIFLVPSWDKWDKWMTLFKRNLVVPGFPEPRHIFIKWFKRKLMQHQGIFIYDADERRAIKIDEASLKPPSEQYERRIRFPKKTRLPEDIYRLALTQDQVNVIHLVEKHLVDKPKGRRKKVLVITADRGRGKSCAVGIGLVGVAYLIRKQKGKRRVRIIVTAPSLSNIQSFFQLAVKAAEELRLKPRVVKRSGMILELHGEGFSIEYWEPIHVPKLKADIVAVDEASGIHVPLLHAIWRAHKRLVFATTIHGYEGAGRGFSVRFMSAIKRDPNTELVIYEMHEPIRYAKNDPIEKWLFDALLLDAEPAELDREDIRAIEEGRLEYLKLDPEWLFSEEGEQTLRQLFGIYVLAHYRNEPDDLAILADAPHHIIRAMATPSGKIVCAVQIAQEGGLDDELIEDLLRGGKIAGNIIPDRVLKHLRLWEFGRKRGWRIVRIATHPEVQGRGIGSRMLEEIYEEAKERGLDWVGSGFGVNEQLLRFWLKNGFVPVHMSPDRNPVSGEYTTLVLKPIAEDVKEMVRIANREFRRKLLESLHDTYRDLELEVARMMLEGDGSPILPGYKPMLTPIQVDRLWIYAYGPMTFEAANDIMHELARAYWLQGRDERPKLSEKEELLLIAKALQGKSWEKVAEELGWKVYKVLTTMKEIARKLLKHYYGLGPDSPVGLHADKITALEVTPEVLLRQPETGLYGRVEKSLVATKPVEASEESEHEEERVRTLEEIARAAKSEEDEEDEESPI